MHMLLPLLLITLPPSAGALIGVSLMFGVFMTAAFFMIAYGLQNPQMIAVAKEELAALLFSVFIILFWLGADATLNTISSGLLLSGLPPDYVAHVAATPTTPTSIANSHVVLAIASLEVLYGKLKSLYIDLYLYEALIGFLSTISFPIGSPLPAVNLISLSLSPFTGLVLLSNAHTTVVESIGYMITLVWAKEFIVLFARDSIPLLILPLGLVLRAFPFFRTTGSSIIALSFAMYFVLPFAVLLSNYLIFDVYKPANFAYTPASSSYFGTDRSATEIESGILSGRDQGQEILGVFSAPDVAQTSATEGACEGSSLAHAFCSFKNIFVGAWEAVKSLAVTIFRIWKFMVGMTGDFFFTLFNNPAMPGSASAGLYYFIIQEVATVSPLIILVMMTTVIEIIITVTMYRSISMVIGGEAELIGITKIV